MDDKQTIGHAIGEIRELHASFEKWMIRVQKLQSAVLFAILALVFVLLGLTVLVSQYIPDAL
jgi:hypothetical protein